MKDSDDKALKRSALAVSVLSAFLTPFMGSAVNLALPAIEKRFSMDAVELSWVATSYLLSAAVFLVPFGRLADLYGRKKIFTWGISIFTLSSVMAGLAFSSATLILARVLQGLGSAMIFANGIAILTSVFPPQERGRVLGINVASVYIGLSVGPFLGGLLTQYLTWRSVFLFTVPGGIAVVALIFWKLKGEWADARGEKFDLFGSVVYGLSITAIMYGVTLLPQARSVLIMAPGIAGVFLFVFWERRVDSPVFEISLFTTNRPFAFSNLAALINYSATFAVTFLMSLYLQHIKALAPRDAGLVLMAQPVVMAVLSPFAGRLSDRVEPRIVASGGMAFTTLGLALLFFCGANTGIPYIVVSLVVLGFGYAFFSSPNTNAIMGSVKKRHFGIASGSVGTMRLLGQMISMGIATSIFAVYIGRARITPELHPLFIKSVKAALVIFACLCFAGIFASMVRGKIREG